MDGDGRCCRMSGAARVRPRPLKHPPPRDRQRDLVPGSDGMLWRLLPGDLPRGHGGRGVRYVSGMARESGQCWNFLTYRVTLIVI
jgi:hypothetical protein